MFVALPGAVADAWVCPCRIHRFYNPELDLAQRREAKLEARSISYFGPIDAKGSVEGNATNSKHSAAASKQVPTNTV